MTNIFLLLILIFAGIAGFLMVPHIDRFIKKLHTWGWRKL